MSWIKAIGFSADNCAFEFYWQGISVFVVVDHRLKFPTIVWVCVCGCMCAGRMGSGVRPGVLTVDVISLRGLISGFMVTVFRFVGQVEGFMCESLVFSVW